MSAKKIIRYILILIAIFAAANLFPYLFGIGTSHLVKSIIGNTETENEAIETETETETETESIPVPVPETETEIRISQVISQGGNIPQEETKETAQSETQLNIGEIEKRNQDYDTQYENYFSSFQPVITEKGQGVKDALIGDRLDAFKISIAGYYFSNYGDQYKVEKIRLDSFSIDENSGKKGNVTVSLSSGEKRYSQKLTVAWDEENQSFDIQAAN